MAELTTLARPYAKAVFSLAESTGQTASWSEMLKYAATVAVDGLMTQLLSHPTLTNEQKAAVFTDVCTDKLSEAGKTLISVLAKNKRLALLPFIAQRFEVLKAQQERSVDVVLASPFELTTAQTETLVKALTRKLDRRVNLSTKVDKTLIGGLVIRAGDVVIDASVRGKLAKLAEAIAS